MNKLVGRVIPMDFVFYGYFQHLPDDKVLMVAAQPLFGELLTDFTSNHIKNQCDRGLSELLSVVAFGLDITFSWT